MGSTARLSVEDDEHLIASRADLPTHRIPPVSRREVRAVFAVMAAFLGILITWSVLTPVYGAPDEHAHVNSVIRLTQGPDWPAPAEGRFFAMVLNARDDATLPADARSTFAALDEGIVKATDQMTQHPPLYYGLGSVVLRAIDFMDLRADIAVVALRLAGLVFALPLPWLIWNSVRRLTGSPRAAVVAASAILAVPQLAHIFAAVSNDGLIVLLCSVVCWLVIRVLTGDARRRIIVATGVALGLALLTKGTALPLIPFTAIAFLVWPRTLSWPARLTRAAAAMSIAFVVGGWWWLRNLLLYGDLQPSGLENVRKTVPWADGTAPNLVDFFDRMWDRLGVSFWGNFGSLQHGLPHALVDVLTVVALVLLVAAVIQRDTDRWRFVLMASVPVIVLLMLFANTWRHYLRTQIPAGFQGRYFFVCIVILIALCALAAYRWVPAPARRGAGTAVVVTAFSMAYLGLFREYIGVYEDSFYRITVDGLRELARYSTAGVPVLVVVAVLAVASSSYGLIEVVRYVRASAIPLKPVRHSE